MVHTAAISDHDVAIFTQHDVVPSRQFHSKELIGLQNIILFDLNWNTLLACARTGHCIECKLHVDAFIVSFSCEVG